MIGTLLDDTIDFVTTHNRVVILVMLLLTAGVAAGMANIDAGEAEDEDMFPNTTVNEKVDYIEEHYAGDESDEHNVAPEEVYVRDEGDNALSKDALLDSLEYQQAVTENESVANALSSDGEIISVAGLVATMIAEDPDADLDEQFSALESASEDEVEAIVQETFSESTEMLWLLSNNYDPATSTAESHRMVFEFEADDDGAAPDNATKALFEAAGDGDSPEYFTMGEHALVEANEQMNDNTVGLILPIALLLILGVLTFTYRDAIDVIVGMVGVVVSIVWMFGIIGWLEISAGITMIVGPILIAALSIDYGFHIFMRYREQRGEEEAIRPPMYRGVRSVAVALALVTLTAGLGFLSNVVNPLDNIRDLGIGITLGVISSFIIFVTLVPALKISIDGLFERFGYSRRKRPLGEGEFLKPFLRSGVTLARRAALIVVVISLVVASGSVVAWSALDEEPFEQQTEPAAEWKTNLPGPMAWEDPEYNMNEIYVQDEFQPVVQDDGDRLQILIEGDVTGDDTLTLIDEAGEADALDEEASESDIISPLAVMQSVAEEDDEFATALEEADTSGDGVPDTNIESLYDDLFELSPETAEQVIERTDGEYQSVRIIGPADGGGTLADRAESQEEVATIIEDGGSGLTATSVSETTMLQSGVEAITDGVLHVMLLALGAVFVTYVLISKYLYDSATLGAITVIPVGIVTGLVIVSMYILDVELTLVTALLMSLVIGIGIDYSIHISDRFAQELESGLEAFEAMDVAVVGTGGALLGSALTTAVAFASILLHPHPQFQNMGTLVVLALLLSFLVSVFVLPSLLTLWVRHIRGTDADQKTAATPTPQDD